MSDNNQEQPQPQPQPLVQRRYIVIGGFVILGLLAWYFIWFFGINKQSLSTNAGDWGAFGDFFGGILNPIFAGAGLLLLLLTLRQNERALKQAEQMIEQGQAVIEQNAAELRASRDELEQSRRAQQELAKIEEKNLQREERLLRVKEMRDLVRDRREEINGYTNRVIKGDYRLKKGEECSRTKVDFSVIDLVIACRLSQTEKVIFDGNTARQVVAFVMEISHILKWMIEVEERTQSDYQALYGYSKYQVCEQLTRFVRIVRDSSVTDNLYSVHNEEDFITFVSKFVEGTGFGLEQLKEVLGVDTHAQTE